MEPWIENGLKLLGAGLTAALVALVLRPQHGQARREGGRRVLYFGVPYKAMFAAMTLVAGFLAYLAVAHYPTDPQEQLAAHIVLGGMGMILALLAYPLWWVELSYDDAALYVTNLRHRNHRIPWQDVTGVQWSDTWQGYYLLTNGHGSVWFWKLQVGHDELRDQAVRRARGPDPARSETG